MRRIPALVSLVLLLLIRAAGPPAHAATAPQRAARELPDPVPCDECWVPEPGTAWQWNLTPPVDPAVDAKLFDIDAFEQTAQLVRRLHDAGKKVYCYIDAGSWADYRPDADEFPEEVLGNVYAGYPHERWLDVRRLDVLGPIMEARMDICVDKGFDGAQFDNVDGWGNDTGFPLTRHDDLVYSVWLANAAHEKGLGAAFENALENARVLVDYTEWQISEECVRWHECAKARFFVEDGKLFGDVEYRRSYADLRFCGNLERLRISGMFKRYSLNAFRVPCP